ncbi:2Fe-2S iron-sulfur cluster-binding protein [Rubeoparvulum massiliense]|uniref:2Fe-2S iron-sulfur cluster-binding protein n=1 Tax=Rubeoparvulum massiliense TaxID=1631346 RepID=UPI00065E2263|nr:2Fe-2S iron-sulfur cluster-binding protein [Rubeoparvulum massiliense]
MANLQVVTAQETVSIPLKSGATLLHLIQTESVPWGFNCLRGTCARCRCQVLSGQDGLQPPTEAEELRLRKKELAEGFRLACQAIVKDVEEDIIIQYTPYR